MHPKKSNGFSLVEVLVGTAIFLIVAISAYGIFANVFRLANGNQARMLAIQLADEQFEIVRNMPYLSVGLTNGIPLGILPQNQTLVRGNVTFDVGMTIRNVNFSTTSYQASSKLVEITVTCSTCQNFNPVTLTGQISPANLQSAGDGGAIVVQVFDANGQPVVGAEVVIQSVSTSTITNTDVTNNNGILNVIGVPPGNNAYRITVSKAGYSTERTYSIGGAGNPNPIKPDATVLNQQVTQVSFAIDKLSTLHFSSVGPLCNVIPNVEFNLSGAKQIGADIPKYSEALSTDTNGTLTLNSMEWDTYTLLPTEASYDIYGINPISPFALNPDNIQEVQLVGIPSSGNSLMVTVVDSALQLPISGVEVNLSKTGYDVTKITGQGYMNQTDWSAGSGQILFTDPTKYYSDNGLVDTSTSTGDILLDQAFGLYNINSTGTLESSTFDTGTTSNFYTFSWNPSSQPSLAGVESVKFQFASNDTSTSTSWDYKGPDGTSSSFFTVPGSSINNNQNGKQFVRYKAYLSTEVATVTPMVSDVSFAYTSGCIPPGQVLFQNLSGTYTLTVEKAGYITVSGSIDIGSDWQQKKVLLELQ
ncbi:MAG: carboxypeptidase regulatory-like domain-containing protein [Candidatus Paceibacterota bacterium]